MKELSVRESTLIRIDDLLKLSERRRKPVFTDFLNEQEQFHAENYLRERKADHLFWGGHDSCIRKMLCISPDGIETGDFPAFPVTVSFRKADKLTHRDFLGSFLSLGLERDQLGDILIGEGCAFVFCTKTARDLICSGISKVGRVGVSLNDGIVGDIPEVKFEEVTYVLSSMRADCVVSAVTGLSRERSSEFIRSGYFMLNYEDCTNISRNLSAGDIITMRGYGKFILTDDMSETKKGKLRVILKKYS